MKACVVGGYDILILPKNCTALAQEGKQFCNRVLRRRRSDQYDNNLNGFVCCSQQMKLMCSAIFHPAPSGDGYFQQKLPLATTPVAPTAEGTMQLKH